MKVVAFVPDLMDRSRIQQAAGDHELEFVRAASALATSAGDVVVVDLARPGVLEAIADVTARTIGFGAHVDTDLLDRARAAGVDEVLPRSEFFRRVADLLS
jgi:hypothetical protein